MNVGLAVLDAAFAVVALWLLGELLLQHRAPAHWRALALAGFLVLVAGVQSGSAAEIGAGVLAFGAGQGMVTRAVKRGGGPHWSLRGRDGALPGPLARVPALERVFPAAELSGPGPAAPAPAPRVGSVGPIELEDDAPAPAADAPELITQDYGGPQAETAYQPQPQPQPYGGYPDPAPGYGQEYAPAAGYQQGYGEQAGQPVQPGQDYAGAYGQQYGQQFDQQAPAQPYAQPYPQPDYYAQQAPGYGYDPGQQQSQQQGGYYPAVPGQQPGYQQGGGYDPAGYQQPAPGYSYDYLGQGPEQAGYQRQPEQPQPHAHQPEPPQPKQPQPPYAAPEPWNYG
ncbi:hypothetical protein GXW83_09245 [Streptacidiphilus sp. PB12-B1b]|uniref:hypothetical protein n=1 Tax=Streptacidiphilus sp. PB12-B1b TaxID=2705012 RepID=UPI0015FCCFD0|nr:hypothetical protein [Streptacidiphilus sp. PB12-B1b]QMU75893.1 hypothetical protein GXW83_09245 [Streptacidiphilus sp. PB12-B1b]